MKNLVILSVLIFFATACKRESVLSIEDETKNINAPVKAEVKFDNNTIKNWATTSSLVADGVPVPGLDFYASRSGSKSETLNIISFGKFTDDKAYLAGNKLSIFLKNVTGVGVYPIGGTNSDYAVLSIPSTSSIDQYSTDKSNVGTVSITTYDNINGSISGKFSFTATTSSKGVKVENGVFENVSFK